MSTVDTPLGAYVHERITPMTDMQPGHRDFEAAVGRPHLIGSRCRACGTEAFPVREVCMTCGARELAQVALPDEGVLYSWTLVHISSSHPTPYAIGYVDLPNGVRLLAPLEGTEALGCDAPVRLAIRGERWMFRPAGDAR